MLNLLHHILLPKNENLTETETLTVTSTQAILYSPMTSNHAYVSPVELLKVYARFITGFW